jgi:hypothetical protein
MKYFEIRISTEKIKKAIDENDLTGFVFTPIKGDVEFE